VTLVLLIVVPAVVIGGGVVLYLDHTGVLPRWDGGSGSGFLESVPRPGLWAAVTLMGAWILAWLVLLVVGLRVLAQ